MITTQRSERGRIAGLIRFCGTPAEQDYADGHDNQDSQAQPVQYRPA
jgi:hypothetical protein